MGEGTRKRHIYLGLVFCLGMNLFMGCKEKSVDYRIEGVTESTQAENGGNAAAGRGKKGLAQFAEAGKWNEYWETEDEKENSISILVDADIAVPDAGQMPVVEVKEPEFNAAYKKQLAECLFGDSEIRYSEEAPLPTSYIDERYSFNQYNMEEYQGSYEGVYEGKTFTLSFFESNSYKVEVNAATGICRNKEILFQAKDVYPLGPSEIKEVGEPSYRALTYGISENRCELSMEEAKEMADHFIEELKLDYSVYASCNPLGWWKGTDSGGRKRQEIDYIADGYVFYYDAGIDSMSFTGYETQEIVNDFPIQKKESEEPQYFMKARMEVYVNGNGVIGMKAQNPIEVTAVLEETKLLSLDAIQGIIKERLTDEAERFRLRYPNAAGGDIQAGKMKYLSFNQMELIYFRVRDKENAGYYSYVPAWRLAYVMGRDVDGYATLLNEQVLINAIDGSVIDFYDEA